MPDERGEKRLGAAAYLTAFMLLSTAAMTCLTVFGVTWLLTGGCK